MRLTKPQQKALRAKWIYSNQNKTYLQFRRAVHELFMGEGAIVVQWNGMWLVIEPDGYVHTQDSIMKNNFVAKHANKYNKAKVFKDRKKASKKIRGSKHKSQEQYYENIHPCKPTQDSC